MTKNDEDYYVLYKAPNGIHYYYVYRFGRRVKRSTGERVRSRAIRVANERKDRHDLLNEGKAVRYQRFRDFAEPFWDYDRCPIIQDKIRRGGHYSKDLANTNRHNVQKYLIPYFGPKVLEEITPAMVNNWLLGLPKKYGVTPQTASKQLCMLRQMLAVAVFEGLIDDNPASDVKPLVAKPTDRGCYTTEQIRRLFSEPWNDVLCEYACRLSSLTGMRVGEVQGLTWDCLHDDWISLKHSWAKKEGLKCPKNGRSRVVPIPFEFAEMLRTIPPVSDLIFTFNGENPISERTILSRLHERMEVVGIDWKKDKLGFHSFRHYFNTRLIAKDVSEAKIRSVIGHGSQKMTDKYAHLSAEDLRQIRTVQEVIA